MKSFYIFLFIFGCLLFLACDLKSQKTTDLLAVDAVCRGTYNFPRSHNPHKAPYYYLLGIKLTNNSSELLNFLSLSCTPMYNVITDPKDYKICSPICPGNTVMPVTLKPGQKLSFSIIIETYLDNLNDSIKVGWIYLNYENTKNVDDFFMRLDQAHVNNTNVIWSKRINLDKFYNEQIEIQ